MPQSGTLPGAITNVAVSPTITAVGETRRYEVQYRILDLNAGAIVPAGLASGNLRITITGTGFGNSTLGRAQLSRFEAQLAASTPPTSPDTSGNATVVSTAGLHRPFRGGIPTGGTNPPAPNNNHPANGVFSADSRVISGITPLSLSQNDQGNANFVADPMAWYGLYSFTLMAGSAILPGTAVLTASFDADATTGIRFGYFNDGDPVPLTSSNAQSATLNQVILGGATGACCPPDATCTIQNSTACAGLGGIYQGDGTTCQPSTCPPIGACCEASGTCALRNPANCGAAIGVYQGDGTVCGPTLCPQPAACCLPGGVCQFVLAQVCGMNGGFFLGAGTSCSPSPCISGPVYLQLRIVPQSGTLPGPIVDATAPIPASAAGQQLRFEVQYRILDTNLADAIVPAGLVSGNLRIELTGPGIGNSTLGRAQLSRFEAQLAAATPPVSPDYSGFATLANTTGLHRPFRGGIPTGGSNPPPPNNDDAANGAFDPSRQVIFRITPLSLSQNDQGNANVVADPAGWYGLYSFTLVAGTTASAGSAIISASFDADAMTGNRFGYFIDGDPVPVASGNTSPVSITVPVNIGPLGACCAPIGTCAIRSFGVCAAEGGAYTGDNTICLPSVCPPVGACCTAVGTCTLVTAPTCTGGGLTYRGDGSLCSPNPCPQAAACCLPSGACMSLMPAACQGSAGTFVGAGSVCTPTPCAPPYACCLPGFTCLIASSSSDCVTAGGTPLLRGTCAPQVCCPSAAVTAQPQSQLLTVSQPIALSVSASHPGALSYRWRHDGVALADGGRISGSGTSTLSLAAAEPGDAGAYDVVMTASCGTVTISSSSTLTLCTAPSIAVQPVSLQRCEGQPADLSVVVGGTPGLIYQWRKDGSPINGATSSTLALASPLAGDSGSYDCVITNPCGSVTSAAATLDVNTPPVFTSNPADTAVCLGASATLTAAAAGGTFAPAYQWRKNLAEIPGANASSYTIPAALIADEGSYDCVVTTACGLATSAPATLTVNRPPTITADPVSTNRCPGESAEFTVATSGLAPFTYQWRRVGAPIDGATVATLTIGPITPGDAGAYDCVVTNACGTATSQAATLVVNTPVTISMPPGSITRCVGAAASFAVVAAGSPAPTYQWRRGGAPIDGATAAIYTIASVAEADAAQYDCVVANVCGAITSSPAALTVTTAPSITAEPQAQNPCEGSSATFQVVAAGTPPLSYLWRLNGSPVSGGQAATLVIGSVDAGDLGSYDCIVTNACGSATSAAAALTIGNSPSIAVQPTSLAPVVGAHASLSVQVAGAEPLLYLWRRNGVAMTPAPNIPSVTEATLAFSPVTVADDALYDCVIANPCGTVTTTPAAVQVSCVGAGPALDCNGNGLCDVLELAGLRDIIAPAPAAQDLFGWNVAIDGDRVLVGARGDDTPQGVNAGSAHLYRLAGGVWSLEASLSPPDGEPGAEFGNMSAVQGQWAFVAARFATVAGQASAGAVYIYRNTGASWAFFQKLTEPTPTFGAWFGHGIDLDGDRAIIGAMRGNGPQVRSGVAYVYRFNGLNWAREATLAAPDGGTDDGFGISVSLDDPYAVVGAPYDDDGGGDAGAAYIYFRSPGGWVFQTKAVPPMPQPVAVLGEVVAISGDIVAASARLESVNSLAQAGAVHTFRRTDTRWTHQRRIISAAPQPGEFFGYDLAMEGDLVSIGGFFREVAGVARAGSVDVFRRRGNDWLRADRIESPKPEIESRFGYALALSGARMVVGAYGGSAALVPDAGWVRVFDLGVLDCDEDRVPDVCELANGTAIDGDGNGIPDHCQQGLCRPDVNDSGVLSVQDIFDFLADYFAGNLTADFNDSGVLSVQDIFDFLASYFSGCA